MTKREKIAWELMDPGDVLAEAIDAAILSAKKDAEREKWKLAAEKARRTATWAKTMTKVVISQNNGDAPYWHVINFLGDKKAEPRGIVDLLAIRKNQRTHALPLKRGDLFDVVLIQVKGGSAKNPSTEDRERLRVVAAAYNAKDVLLSEWVKGSKPVFKRLVEDDWIEVEASEVFGPTGKGKNSKATSKTATVENATKARKSSVSGIPPSSKSNAAKKAWSTRKDAKSVAL